MVTIITICARPLRSAYLPQLVPTHRHTFFSVRFAMTPIRQRFIEDLQLRNRSVRTVQAYVLHLRNFARYFNKSPDLLDPEQARQYLVHLLQEKKASWPQYNQAVSALRFFYQVTSPRDQGVVRLPYGKRPKRLPIVRSPEQVAQFLDAVV